jgi:hypothetical protein
MPADLPSAGARSDGTALLSFDGYHGSWSSDIRRTTNAFGVPERKRTAAELPKSYRLGQNQEWWSSWDKSERRPVVRKRSKPKHQSVMRSGNGDENGARSRPDKRSMKVIRTPVKKPTSIFTNSMERPRPFRSWKEKVGKNDA